jgi:2-polyprenyl-3-methyl-5-hydroxy-6-metoxy-1,4-benzoquinol methylase
MSKSGAPEQLSCWTLCPEVGHYAKKQLLCDNAIIAWSHQSRFTLARKLVEPYAGKKLLDYGCGDGTFLAEVYDLFPTAVGADIEPKQTLDCRARFAHVPGISFMMMEELAGPAHERAYGVVTCMEVLEHCLDEELDRIVIDLRRLVSPHGLLIVRACDFFDR